MEKTTIQLNTKNISDYSRGILREMVNYQYSLNKEDLIKPVSKYVELTGYKSVFGNQAYTFSFWGADTLEEAIKLESLETAIVREIHEQLRLAANLEDLEKEIKLCFPNENLQEFISEEVSKMTFKFNLLQKQRAKRKKILLIEENVA